MLKKSFTSRYGYHSVGVHKVRQVAVDEANKEGHVLIHSFSSKTAHDDECDPVRRKTYLLNGADFTLWLSDAKLLEVNKSPLFQAYAYLKTLEEFDGAMEV